MASAHSAGRGHPSKVRRLYVFKRLPDGTLQELPTRNLRLPVKRRTAAARKREKTTREVGEGALGLIKAFAKRAGEEDPSEHIEMLLKIRSETDQMLTDAVTGWRATNWSDREIAAELGVSRQAVSKRWPRTPDKKEH